MKLRALTFTISILLASHAWSFGDEKENGGDIIICKGNGSYSYKLLDLHEAQASHKLTLITANKSTTDSIFEERMQSLEKVDPVRAELYRSYKKTFSQEAQFLAHSDFPEVVDEGYLEALPKGCRLTQIVIQYDTPTSDGIRYRINQDLLSLLDEENRAALLIHEFIYREARLPKNDFQTSYEVRYLNAVIHSTKMPGMSLKKHIQQLREIGIPELVIQGQPIIVFTLNDKRSKRIYKNVDFHANEKVAHATLAPHFYIPGIGDVMCNQEIKNKHEVSFFDSGALKTIHVGCENMVYGFSSTGMDGYVLGSTFNYNEDGHLNSVSVDNKTGDVLLYSSSNTHITGIFSQSPSSASVSFYPDGTPKAIWSSDITSWRLYKKELDQQWHNILPIANTIHLTPLTDSCKHCSLEYI